MRPSLFRFPSPFNPATDGGTIIWFKADALSLSDGASVSPWTASTGTNAASIAGHTTPIFKTNIKNGLPVVRFGSQDALGAGTPTHGQPFQLFVVFKLAATTPTNSIVNAQGAVAAGGGAELLAGAASTHWAWNCGLTAQNFGTSDTNWHIILVEGNTSSSRWQVDGGALTTFGSSVGAGTVQGMGFGGSLNTACDVGEALIRTGTLDPSSVFTYLNGRWAVY